VEINTPFDLFMCASSYLKYILYFEAQHRRPTLNFVNHFDFGLVWFILRLTLFQFLNKRSLTYTHILQGFIRIYVGLRHARYVGIVRYLWFVLWLLPLGVWGGYGWKEKGRELYFVVIHSSAVMINFTLVITKWFLFWLSLFIKVTHFLFLTFWGAASW